MRGDMSADQYAQELECSFDAAVVGAYYAKLIAQADRSLDPTERVDLYQKAQRIVLDDTAVIGIVDKLIKQRKDSIAAFTQAGRTDLVDKESAEVQVLESYLPQRLSSDEIAAAIGSIVQELGASGPGDMGKVMGAAKARLAGKADMGLVSAAVKQALAR
jgi:uncharacterized protein YqeY